MKQFFEYYRCPEEYASFAAPRDLRGAPGYYRFGPEAVCFGQSNSKYRPCEFGTNLQDVANEVCVEGTVCRLPFDPGEVVDNLRHERYVNASSKNVSTLGTRSPIRRAYRLLRPLMPLSLRKRLQRMHLRGWEQIPFPSWPVDRSVDCIIEKLMLLALKTSRMPSVPFIWFWPEGHSSCAVMTHDVETSAGRESCYQLMDLDDRRGLKSSFQVIPEERYAVPSDFLKSIRERGFEINIHDLNHDGELFTDRERFLMRAMSINRYASRYNARGFRSGALYRNPDWYDALNFSYDMSFPNVGHLDAQRGGCCTVMPFFIGKILEIPLTTIQDYSLFYILEDYSLDLWHRQIRMIMEGHGLISFIVHPDYILRQRARNAYERLLDHLAYLRSEEKVWTALPGEVDQWWRNRNQMKLVKDGAQWRIEGPGSERARIAYAMADGDHIVYKIEGPQNAALRCEGTKSDLASSRMAVAAVSVPPPVPETLAWSLERQRQPNIYDFRACLGRPIRACMVGYAFYEMDNRIRRYAETLVRLGHEVDAIVIGKEGQRASEVISGVRVYRVQRRVINEKGQLSYLGRLLLFLLKSSWFLTLKQLRSPYDLVHVHSVPDFEVTAAWLPKIMGSKVILDIHDLVPELYTSKFNVGPESFIRKLLIGAERISAHFSDHVIVANHIWQRTLQSRSVKADECTAILNFPDPHIFYRRGRTRSDNKFVLLYPGTLNSHQGLDIAIRAFARIKDQTPQAEFHIYGRGPEKSALTQLISELHLEDRVFLRDPVPLPQIAEIMENADLGVVPKRKSSFGNEAFSTKIFEFMALGVPVLAADTRIDRYYFDDSIIRFFRSEDEADLASNMLAMITQKPERDRLARNAAEFMKGNSWEEKKNDYLALIQRLLKPKNLESVIS